MEVLTEDHLKVLTLFYQYPKGFLVLYPSVGWWFFVRDGGSDQSETMPWAVCDDLRNSKIVSEDLESQVQFAVGARRFRIYKLRDSINYSLITRIRKLFEENSTTIAWL